MSAKKMLTGGLKKIASAPRSKVKKGPQAPPLPTGEFDAIKKPASDFFSAGFGKATIIPPDLLRRKYYVAGYNINNPAKGILDIPHAHALWLDDNSGRGAVVFVSLDAVVMLKKDVETAKASMAEFLEEKGCRNINIICTHSHAGIDTMGLWGPLPKTGRDPKYMEVVFEGIRQAVESAYKDCREGSFYLGRVEVEGMQKDIRTPEVFSKTLTRLRFEPRDGSRDIYFINFAGHPETLGSKNSLVSADFPAYLRKKIYDTNRAETVYCVGAIGGMITMHTHDGDKVESTKKIGRDLADFVLAIKDEEKLEAKVNYLKQEFYADVDNFVLMLAAKTGILKADRHIQKSSTYGYVLKSEMTYFEIGSLSMLLLPCEIFPELVFGGYLSAEESATGLGPEINPTPLTEIAGEKELLVFGLANDELGYVLPPNDFILAEGIPYLDRVRDRHDRNHYEETNSMGPKTAEILADVFEDMIKTVRAVDK